MGTATSIQSRSVRSRSARRRACNRSTMAMCSADRPPISGSRSGTRSHRCWPRRLHAACLTSSGERTDMNEAIKSGSVAFQPRARLLKLIGAELISDEVVAVTEVVKNAYDADASTVIISFRNVSAPGGSISIEDDGTGMDLDTGLGAWMEPGATSTSDGARRRTGRRRRVLGEKGVGRFAADKLGRFLEIVSRRVGAGTEVKATFDFDLVDSGTE